MVITFDKAYRPRGGETHKKRSPRFCCRYSFGYCQCQWIVGGLARKQKEVIEPLPGIFLEWNGEPQGCISEHLTFWCKKWFHDSKLAGLPNGTWNSIAKLNDMPIRVPIWLFWLKTRGPKYHQFPTKFLRLTCSDSIGGIVGSPYSSKTRWQTNYFMYLYIYMNMYHIYMVLATLVDTCTSNNLKHKPSFTSSFIPQVTASRFFWCKNSLSSKG